MCGHWFLNGKCAAIAASTTVFLAVFNVLYHVRVGYTNATVQQHALFYSMMCEEFTPVFSASGQVYTGHK